MTDRTHPPAPAAGAARALRVALIAILAFGLIYVVVVSGRGAFAGWIGVPAPDLAVTTIDGDVIRLSDLRGKRVLIDFWATWCPPCRDEIPGLIALRDELNEDEYVILGVSLEEPEVIRAFADSEGVNYPLASVSDLPAPYRLVTALPTKFLLDRNGVIQHVEVGRMSDEAIRAMLTGDDYDGVLQPAPREGS